ncbi:MAG: A/G-specific adenine glycosylase [Gammaproteobacteria bacterium]|nr:A/G-specific adenine glycosylase [Gammaproteobacteria bacterium]
MSNKNFSQQLLTWFDYHGRKDLPWQQNPTPYRVWVSEIMLQQTQVSTVIDYFTRFMQRFPDVQSLANAELDEVLHLWTGLGYYARARNLHRAAQIIRDEYNGEFPTNIADVINLPGIGLSTAGAILSLALNQRQPILDGNVKRVLSRYHGIEGWPGTPAIEKAMWQLAEQHTPMQRNAAYTQAIMDLGATLCNRRPDCDRCPVHTGCVAQQQGLQTQLPSPKPKKALPLKRTVMLVLRNAAGEVLLHQRPPTGIWGGLWSFPEATANDDQTLRQWSADQLGHEITIRERWPTVRHTFSHFHLDIEPVVAELRHSSPQIREASAVQWLAPGQPPKLGLAAPVKLLLQQLAQRSAEVANP